MKVVAFSVYANSQRINTHPKLQEARRVKANKVGFVSIAGCTTEST